MSSDKPSDATLLALGQVLWNAIQSKQPQPLQLQEEGRIDVEEFVIIARRPPRPDRRLVN